MLTDGPKTSKPGRHASAGNFHRRERIGRKEEKFPCLDYIHMAEPYLQKHDCVVGAMTREVSDLPLMQKAHDELETNSSSSRLWLLDDRAGLHDLEYLRRHGLELIQILIVPSGIGRAGDEPINVPASAVRPKRLSSTRGISRVSPAPSERLTVDGVEFPA
jgi:hypothetical protein